MAPREPDRPVAPRRLSAVALGAPIALAIVLIAAFGHAVWRYETTPGGAGDPGAYWPADARLEPAADTATIVMLAHPRCPCTPASLDELEHVLRSAPGPVRTFVVIRDHDGDAIDTPLGAHAARLPGASVVIDTDGALTRAFALETSGHIVAYDVDRRRVFSGGITLARGERGDSPGRRALSAALVNATVQDPTAVFGCPLGSDARDGSEPAA